MEHIQKAGGTLSEEHVEPLAERVSSGVHAYRLSALEIAEGALLADVAVIFQLLIRFLPVVGDALRLMVPVVFAVLIVRRGLYVGCMSLCVALFMVAVVLGPTGIPLMLLGAGAGLFLGLTMRHRLRHITTIFLGVVCGALALWAVLLLTSFLSGGPSFLVHGMRQTFALLTPLLGQLFKLVGLGSFWQHTLLSRLDCLIQWGLQHWLLLFYLMACLLCMPLVTVVYLFTNVFLRLLGYQVRPFPGYSLEGLLNRCASQILKLVSWPAFAKIRWLYNLRVEVRRLNIARVRRRRLERGAKSR